MYYRKIFIYIALLQIVFAPLSMSKNTIDRKMTITIDKLRKELTPLNFTKPPEYSDTTLDYFKFYGLNITNAHHLFGTFDSGDYTLAAHIFQPVKSKATIIITHGYYDHAGIWSHIIKPLVDNNFTVAIYDQPGHGLSTGERASIADFSEYDAAQKKFIEICKQNLKGPYHLLAHSMGCSVTIDLLTNQNKNQFGKIILIAPLVRSIAWGISGFSNWISKPFINSVPRKFRKNSSNKEFIAFMKADPLQARRVPLKWVNAQRKWEKHLHNIKPCDTPILILQGTSDTTVKWKYNIPFLKKIFPNAKVEMTKGGGHQLINESKPMRDKLIKTIIDQLEQ